MSKRSARWLTDIRFRQREALKGGGELHPTKEGTNAK
jgi:hypothetical protein